MTRLRFWAVGMILLFGLSLAACSGVGCKSDRIAAYPDSGKSAQEPQKDVQK